MNRKLLLVAVAVLVLAALSVGVALAGEGKTVKTLGDEVLKPNVKVEATLRFSPGPTTIDVGDSITWVGADKADAPHTVTLTRNPDALMDEFADLFGGNCPECDAAIGAALGGHFATDPPTLLVDVGDPGFGDDGDSVLFGGPAPDTTQTLTNVSPGESIFYFCAIHPWMQGSINVNG